MGRAPTSGYCHTCRRRRVKCGRERPECGRCVKSGHKCLGYDLPLRMQNYTVSGESSGSPALVPVASAPVLRAKIAPELPLTAFRNTMAFSHLLANYRWAPFWKPLLRTSISANSTKAEKAHYTAGLATALAYMGTLTAKPKMVSDGYEMNGGVIRALHWALQEKSKDDMARWALTIMVLCMYQYTIEANPNLPHYVGVIQVIEFCGTEHFQHEPMLTIFRQIRAQHSCSSFFHKEASFFEQVAWKTIPWKHNPKTLHDRLIDMYVDLPGLGAMLGPSSTPLTKRQKFDVELRAWDHLSRLYKWRKDWEVVNPKAATEVWLHLPQDADGITIPWVKEILTRAIDVKSANQATDLLIYNSTLVYVMQVLHILRTGNRQPQPFPPERGFEKTTSGPLYMPEEIKHHWQPMVEALRIMRLAPSMIFASDSDIMLAVSVIGIVYNYIRGTPGLDRLLLSTVNNPEQHEAARGELIYFQLPD